MRIAFIAVVLGLAVLAGRTDGQTGQRQKGKAADKNMPAKGTDENPAETYGGKSLYQWRQEMKSQDASKRTQAIVAIMTFPAEKGNVAVFDLIDRLSDSDVGVRVKACLALRYVHLVNSDQIQRAVRGLATHVDPYSETQSIVKYEAATTLLRLAPSAGPEYSKIINGMKDRSAWENRRICASILWRVARDAKGGPDPRVVSEFLNWIPKEHTYQVRLELMKGLGAMGKPANRSLQIQVDEFLQSAARSNNRSLALWGCVALLAHADGNDVETKRWLNKVAHFLNEGDTEIKVQAALALSGMGEKAKSKAPDILAMLKRDKDKDTASVNAACEALGRMKDTSAPVVNALLDLLDNKDPARAAAAVKALVDLDLRDALVMNALKKTQANVNIHAGLKGWVDEAIKLLSAPPAPAKK